MKQIKPLTPFQVRYAVKSNTSHWAVLVFKSPDTELRCRVDNFQNALKKATRFTFFDVSCEKEDVVEYARSFVCDGCAFQLWLYNDFWSTGEFEYTLVSHIQGGYMSDKYFVSADWAHGGIKSSVRLTISELKELQDKIGRGEEIGGYITDWQGAMYAEQD